MTDVAAPEKAARAQAKPGGWRMFDFQKPIDLNTIIIIVAFIGGGMMFVANTNAEMSAVRQEVRDQGDTMRTLTQRIDTLFLTQRQTAVKGRE